VRCFSECFNKRGNEAIFECVGHQAAQRIRNASVILNRMTSRPKSYWWLASLGVAAGIGLVLFLCNPERVPIYPVCLFHKWTGLNCPGCGSLRAMHQLLHGNVSEALHLNALLVLSLPVFAWLGFRLMKQRFTGQPAVVVRPIWVWLYAGVWVVFGIVRVLPLPLFAAWSP
jgi:hypothetical protein